jgi:hypothetical protein
LRDVVPVFVAAVDAGLFQGPKEGQQARVINALAAINDNQRVDEWELLTPPLDAEAFVALARMFWSVGARAVGITEVLRDKERAIRSVDQVPSSTVRVPPWRVERLVGDSRQNAAVTVCFERPVAPDIVTGCVCRAAHVGRARLVGGIHGRRGLPTLGRGAAPVGGGARTGGLRDLRNPGARLRWMGGALGRLVEDSPAGADRTRRDAVKEEPGG